MKMRPYQVDILDRVRNLLRQSVRSIIIQAPTGAGKTALTTEMVANSAAKGYRCWFVNHRRELIRQSSETFQTFGIHHGIIAAGWHPNQKARAQIASIMTLRQRIRHIPPPNIIIWDECHHVAAKTWEEIFRMYPNVIHIGLTATPQRLDGAGLDAYFADMVQGPSTRELIEQGYLCPYRMFSIPGLDMTGVHKRAGDFKRDEMIAEVEKSTVTGDVVNHYQKHAMGRRALVFECSVERSERLADKFRQHGIPAMHVDGKTDSTVRDRAMQDLRAGRLKVITNVDLFGEGLDVPAIEAIFLCRPTNSLGLYLQQVGRGFRTYPGKEDVLIFDHAGNLQRHGPPDMEREWSLKGHAGEAREDSGPGVRQCPACFAVNAPGAPVCVECREPFPAQPREIIDQEGDLSEVDVQAMKRQARKEQGKAQSYEELVELGTSRGQKNPRGWAIHVLKGRAAKYRKMGELGKAEMVERELDEVVQGMFA